MPHVMMIRDQPRTIFGDRNFQEMLHEELGYEAADYFKSALDDKTFDQDLCCGECDRTYRTQEHKERLCRDLAEDVASVMSRLSASMGRTLEDRKTISCVLEDLAHIESKLEAEA